MKTHIRTTTMLGLLALAGGPSIAGLSLASPAQAALSPAAYAVRALCSTPSPGHAGCLGLRLVAKAPLTMPGAPALSRIGRGASGRPSPAVEEEPIEGSLTPGNVLSGYNLSGTPPPASTQTIGIVDAYDDPTAAADLERFDKQFRLPACSEEDGCLRKVNEGGSTGHPPPLDRGWAQEIATDIEVSHGVCPSCHILLVEANSNEYEDLFAAEETAVRLGATEISNSWGGPECADGPGGRECIAESPAFNHPGIVITASSGDNGYLNWLEEPESRVAEYPATSPHVVAVGGTRLILKGAAKTWERETVWNDGGASAGFKEGAGAGGGGCSESFSAAPWQQSAADWSSVGCGTRRAVADVSADADPYTGVAVYDSTENEGTKGWAVIGGTSVASPIVASVFALAGGAQGVEYPARTLYENEVKAPASLHDVTSGSNGECLQPFDEETGTSGCSAPEEAASCEGHLKCLAGPGYDGPSGVGTPNGIGAFQPSSPTSGRAGGGTPSPQPIAPARIVASPAATPSAPPPPPTPTLSALMLTRSAIVALNRVRPKISRVSFAFTLNVAVRVRVTLVRRVRVRGRAQWKTVSPALTLLAPPGRESRHLNGRGVLSGGRYKLTLTPTRGNVASIVFQIG